MNLSVHFSSKNRTKNINYLVVSIQPALKRICSKKKHLHNCLILKLPTHCNLSKLHHPPKKTKKHVSSLEKLRWFFQAFPLSATPRAPKECHANRPLWPPFERELPPPPQPPYPIKKVGWGVTPPKKKQRG